MTSYQFERFPSRVAKRFGTLSPSDVNACYQLVLSMEGNILRVNRRNPKANSARVLEAITLTLIQLTDRLDQTATDVSGFQNPENLQLKNALMSAFDPLTNNAMVPKLREMIRDADLRDPALYRRIYPGPIRVLLYLKSTAEHCIRTHGSDGFIRYLYSFIGDKVPHDEVMNWAMLLLPS